MEAPKTPILSVIEKKKKRHVINLNKSGKHGSQQEGKDNPFPPFIHRRLKGVLFTGALFTACTRNVFWILGGFFPLKRHNENQLQLEAAAK